MANPTNPPIPSQYGPYIRVVPKQTPVVDLKTGLMSRTWLMFMEQVGEGETIPIVGFIINDGSTGTNVGPMLPSPFTGTIDVINLVVKASDASIPLVFDIKQNGTAIFTSPSVAAGTAQSTVPVSYTSLDEDPLPVTYNDIFTIDITSGSSAWSFTVVLETSTPANT
jgi:hypothetical protein